MKVKQRYNVMLNPKIVKKIDYHAEQLELSRSDVINRILFDYLRLFDDLPDPSEPENIEGQVFFYE